MSDHFVSLWPCRRYTSIPCFKTRSEGAAWRTVGMEVSGHWSGTAEVYRRKKPHLRCTDIRPQCQTSGGCARLSIGE